MSTAGDADGGAADGAFYFPGNGALIELIRALYPAGRRSRNRPLLTLVRAERPTPFLSVLRARFRTRSDGAPVVLHRLPGGASTDPPYGEETVPRTTVDDVEQVSHVLRRLAQELGTLPHRRSRIRRFRRFALTVWLMQFVAEDTGGDPDQVRRERILRDRLRSRDRYHLVDVPNALAVPDWLRSLVVLVPQVWFYARVSGRVPIVSGHYRWFLKPSSLAPARASNMPGVGTALTSDEWKDDPHASLLVMVNAFMEDIRAAYRRPVGAARTGCCVLLLENISRRNGGYQLLRAVNEIRNSTRLRDPLLVITEGERVPPYAGSREYLPTTEAAQLAYNAWDDQIDEAERRREPAAWYLALAIPAVPTDPAKRQEANTAFRGTARIDPPAVPILRRRTTVYGAGVLVAAALVVGYVLWSWGHCGNGLAWPGFAPTVSHVGGECVGVSDDLALLFTRGTGGGMVADVGAKMTELNARSESLHEQFPDRPYVTVVDVGIFSAPNGGPDALVAERESFEGVAIAQLRQLNTADPGEPLIRVLAANGGPGMSSGAYLADTIAGLQDDDAPVVAAVGFSQSEQSTQDTIVDLARLGIPSVAATLSADDLADTLLMYHQTAPTNRREASVAAAYAAHLREPGVQLPLGTAVPDPRVRIYVPDDRNDLYAQSLRNDTETAFRGVRTPSTATGFAAESVAFTPFSPFAPVKATDPPPGVVAQKDSAREAGLDACGFSGVVFFAGRPDPDLSTFLGAVNGCRVRPRMILAGDDASRYAANDRARSANSGVPFEYLTFAATPQAALALTPQQVASRPELAAERTFYDDYFDQFPFERTPMGSGASLDGHAALSHDAARVVAQAITSLTANGQSVPVTPAAVWRQISTVAGDRRLTGASGYVDYGGDVQRRDPKDKPVLVVRVENGNVQPTPRGYCGPPADVEPRTESWCPPPETR